MTVKVLRVGDARHLRGPGGASPSGSAGRSTRQLRLLLQEVEQFIQCLEFPDLAGLNVFGFNLPGGGQSTRLWATLTPQPDDK